LLLELACEENTLIDESMKCVFVNLTRKNGVDLANVIAAHGRTDQAIGAGRKGGVELGFIIGQLIDRLDLVEVERKFARNAAIDARLQVGGPVLAKDILAAIVAFANPSNTRVDRLAAVDVLDGRFAEKEVHVLATVEGTDKVGF
jgi:hypothetical protein